ncbi:MAG: cytochrome P450 [Burkholderiaceae bacterium]
MRRTVTRDTVLSGHQFHEGDKTVLFYNSANRDEAVFEDPFKFDLRRAPNPPSATAAPDRTSAWGRTSRAARSR